MSLINEALKKAESEKRSHDSLPWQAVSAEGRGAGKPRRQPVLVILCLVLAAAGAGAWVWLQIGARPAVCAGEPSLNAKATWPEAEPTPLASPGPARSVGADFASADQMPTNAQLTIAETLQSLRYYEPAPETADSAGPPEPEPAAEETHLTEKPDPANYDLSAILRGPDGTTAIINGKFVQEGATVDGAKLIAIGKHQADLEANGQRFRIQM